MKAELGTVICGTMKTEDLIPAFTKVLKELDTEKTYSQLIEDCENFRDYEPEEQEEMLNEELFSALDSFAPSYCYFGSHPGDGSDYGFWVSEDINENFDGKKVSDLSEVSEDYTGEVLYVNDHGNMTLYDCKKGWMSENWSIV